MTTYDGTIEGRRLVVRFNRVPAGGTVEDQDAFSMHFVKITSGAVDTNWLTADYTAVESAFDTCWGSLKPYVSPFISLAAYLWYKESAAWSPADRGNGPPNPAVRTIARSVVGTAAAFGLPPQVAVSCTKQVDVRKRWGRFYLPLNTVAACSNEGRIAAGNVTTWLPALVTWLNACRAASKFPVVFSRERSAYVSGSGSSIPHQPATWYVVNALEMDNLYDIIRSRRWDAPTQRVTTALT